MPGSDGLRTLEFKKKTVSWYSRLDGGSWFSELAEARPVVCGRGRTWWFGLVWFVWFYGISTFVGYLTPNPFLCKSVLLKTVQFSISTQFNCQKHFHFKLFKQLYVIIQLSVNTVLMSVLFEIIQSSISTQFKCKYGLIVKNVSISSYSVYSIHFSISMLLVLFNP